MTLNRFITFIKPLLDAVAAAIASFLIAKLNVLGLPGLDQQNTATWIAAALVYVTTHGALAIGNWSWIKGHHIELSAAAAALVGKDGSSVKIK